MSGGGEKLRAGEAMRVTMRLKLPSGVEVVGNVTEGYYGPGDREAGTLTRFQAGDVVGFGEFAGSTVLQANAEVCRCAACEGYY